MNKRLLMSIGCIGFLSSCASNYDVSTNLDKENFDNYFAVGKVQSYASTRELPTEHEFIGLVDGSSCQEKAHLAAPSEVEAKNSAKRKANKLSANAVIFSECVTITSSACIQERLCYAKAYKVIQND